jgi:pimeloyl-ACP methyl ester carboxylesterase
VYLPIDGGTVFGTYHAASAEDRTTAVLICPPWGWDDVASYRALREWSMQLAATGYSTLRIDLPGTGDSSGTPSDAGLVDAWVAAVTVAAGWLRDQPGISRVAVIGLGIGGLVAGAALDRGAAIDELVLWATPTRGRAFVREQRAFAALQDTRVGMPDDVAPESLPEGWLEVGGFVLSAETIGAIEALDLRDASAHGLQRALLVERDGMGRSPELEANLERQDVVVEWSPGNGWKSMVFHPERYDPPLDVFKRIEGWLAGTPPPRRPSPASPIERESSPDRSGHGFENGRVVETPLRIAQSFGSLFGVLAEPEPEAERDAGSDLCAVFLNAGAVRRIGPNRLWVEISRAWAARGVPSVRMDLEGIGDADGDPDRYRNVGNFYTDEFGAQVGSILDHLEDRGLGPRFILIGLCAGGYWAFHTGAADRRVVAAFIVNPRAMIWDDNLLARREAHKVERLVEPAMWGRILRGEVAPSRMLAVSTAVARSAAGAVTAVPGRIVGSRRSEGAAGPTVARFEALHDAGTRVLLAFADDEPVFDELEADGIIGQFSRWPNVTLEHLPGADHTLRPVVAQAALRELLDRELAEMMADKAS